LLEELSTSDILGGEVVGKSPGERRSGLGNFNIVLATLDGVEALIDLKLVITLLGFIAISQSKSVVLLGDDSGPVGVEVHLKISSVVASNIDVVGDGRNSVDSPWLLGSELASVRLDEHLSIHVVVERTSLVNHSLLTASVGRKGTEESHGEVASLALGSLGDSNLMLDVFNLTSHVDELVSGLVDGQVPLRRELDLGEFFSSNT